MVARMKQLSATPAKPVRITKALLEEWATCEERRLEFQRQASDLGKRQREIERDLMPAVLARCAGAVRRIVTCGYELAITTRPGTVSWKSEFIRVTSEAAAALLVKNAPAKDSLEIRKL